VTGSGGTALLGLATAVVTIVTFAFLIQNKTVSPWPAFGCAIAAVLWFMGSIPFAAIKVAHDERLGRIDAEDRLHAEKDKRPRAEVKGEIESLERLRSSSATFQLEDDPPVEKTSTRFWAWLRLTISGSSSSLLRWKVDCRDKTGAAIESSVPYSQDTMPTRSGPPAMSIQGLQNTALETGRSVEVCIGFDMEAALTDMDISSLRVCFVDAWDNPYEIGPAQDIQVVPGRVTS
jgi:hypothetical protein